jgi:hypothetical protein
MESTGDGSRRHETDARARRRLRIIGTCILALALVRIGRAAELDASFARTFSQVTAFAGLFCGVQLWRGAANAFGAYVAWTLLLGSFFVYRAPAVHPGSAVLSAALVIVLFVHLGRMIRRDLNATVTSAEAARPGIARPDAL